IVGLAGLALIAVPVYLARGGNAAKAKANSAQPGPVLPDINLTVRKGLPFPALTPGERTSSVRQPGPITEQLRQKVISSYGITPESAQSYVMVRPIPPQLGGTDNPANLSPTTP